MNNNYDKYLLAETTTIVILLCVLIVLAIVIMCFAVHYFKNKQKSNAIACCVFSVTIIAACIFGVLYLVPYTSDVRNQSYIKYEGIFYVEGSEYDLRSGSQPLVKFANDEKSQRYKVRGNTYLQDGCHEGYVVYAKHSKVIVEWYCEDCRE